MSPPAMINGYLGARMSSTARPRSPRSALVRAMTWTLVSKNSVGWSYAIATTSCGSPMNAGSHSTGANSARVALGNELRICAGSVIRSQYRATGRNASFNVIDGVPGCSTCPNWPASLERSPVSRARSPACPVRPSDPRPAPSAGSQPQPETSQIPQEMGAEATLGRKSNMPTVLLDRSIKSCHAIRNRFKHSTQPEGRRERKG